MKKRIVFFSLVPVIMLCFAPLSAQGATLPERLAGRILLQVESHGEGWYVYPVNRLRYYLGRPDDAFRIMRELGLGISESDYERYKDSAPAKLEGRIMLRVEENGEAYYADPISKDFVYLGRPDDAFRIMREHGLGITNDNLAHMPISGNSVIPPDGVVNIVLEEPDWNEELDSPFVVAGEARVFENTVNIRLRNSNDRILASAITTAEPPDVGEYGMFSKAITFTSPGTTTGYVEVFSESAKDGSEINKVMALIRF